MHDSTRWDAGLSVTGDAANLIPHAGAALLRLTAARTGLTAAISQALAREDFTPDLDRGQVLADIAVMMADGGNTMRAIEVLRHQEDLYGPVASPATVCRTLAELDAAALEELDAARARVRQRVWEQIVARHGRIPPALTPCGDLGDQIVLRVDAHFIDATSNKEQAQRLRGRFGHHPIAVFCDNTRECLAVQLRRGGASANDAADHIAVLTRAIAQIPPALRGNLLITADGAGATHQLLDWITSLNRPATDDEPGMRVEYSVGWPVDKHTGAAIAQLPESDWTAMLAADGLPGIPARLQAESGPDTVGQVADITTLLHHLGRWPTRHRVYVRRVKPLRGTTPKPLTGVHQLELDLLPADLHGWRYEAFATNHDPTPAPGETAHQVTAWLDGRHRVHARVEDHFRWDADTGAARLPSKKFTVNTAWYHIHAIAADLIAWTRLLGATGQFAIAEPRTWQFAVFHTPATLTRGARRRKLNFPTNWPWTKPIQAIFTRLLALPALT